MGSYEYKSVVPICLPLECFIFGNTSLVLALTKTKEKERKRKRMGWSELEKYVCIPNICVCWCESVYVFVCLLTAGGETSHLLDMHPVESLQCISPPSGENVNTHNTNPLTHGNLHHTHASCLLASPTLNPLLLPLPSSFLIFFFLFLCCDWQVLCDPADPQQ